MRLRRTKFPGEHTVSFMDDGGIVIHGQMTAKDIERVERCLAAREQQIEERVRKIARDEINKAANEVRTSLMLGSALPKPQHRAGPKSPPSPLGA